MRTPGRREVLTGGLAAAAASAARAAPSALEAAISDPARPAEDRARDPQRHPLDLLAFAGAAPGARIADLLPGGGYFTRLFSKVAGPGGKVYAIVPDEIVKFRAQALTAMQTLAADPAYPNVAVLVEPINAISAPLPLDLLWTSENYHDLHDPFMGPADIDKVNRAVFAALRPGGRFVIADHAAEPGSGLRDTNTLHRIDPAAVIAEVERAGFRLDARSQVLANPADTHALKVFDPAIRGRTDQFLLRFVKPGG